MSHFRHASFSGGGGGGRSDFASDFDFDFGRTFDNAFNSKVFQTTSHEDFQRFFDQVRNRVFDNDVLEKLMVLPHMRLQDGHHRGGRDRVDENKGCYQPTACGYADTAENSESYDFSAPAGSGGTGGGGGDYAPTPSDTTTPQQADQALEAGGEYVPEGERKELIDKALQLAGVPVTPENEMAVNLIISHESEWNVNALNDWDVNWQSGDPSKGLMQVIGQTFAKYAIDGYNTNIYEPLSNIIAGVRYAVDRYGSLLNVPGVVEVLNGRDYVWY